MQKPGLFGMNGFLLFLLTCCSFVLRAQEAGSLILIDAENRKPFTLRIGDQLFASSGHGHMVLSHLKDSSYRLNIRFPNKNLAEQVFPIVVHRKDLGFQLRGADSSWVLYNWQSKESVHPIIEHDSSRILEMGVRREDGFSKLMAAVVDDTAVMYNSFTGNWLSKDSINHLPSVKSIDSVLVKNSHPPNTIPPLPSSSGGQNLQTSIKTPDSVVAKTGQPPPAKTPVLSTFEQNHQPSTNPSSRLLAKNALKPSVTSQRPAIVPGIKKLRDVNLRISRKMVFIDMDREGLKDTITLYVYFEKGDTAQNAQASAKVTAKKMTMGSDSTVISKIQAKNNGAKTFVAGCGEMATEADVQWLRSEILKANTEQDKITAASTAFALKCFAVSQVRLLASLLVSDKARYRLMDAASQHIADRDHFRELVDMYTDKNFQRKFLAMAEKGS